MKFLVVFIHDDDATATARALVREDFRFTRVASTSGLLEKSTDTFLLGVEEERVEECIEVFRANCHERQVAAPGSLLEGKEIDPERLGMKHRPVSFEMGGATGFVLEAEEMFRV